MTTREEILDQVQGVFRKVLNDPSVTLHESTTAEDVNGWDSLSHVKIISEVEKQFKIRFSIKEMLTWKTVGDMIDSLYSKLA